MACSVVVDTLILDSLVMGFLYMKGKKEFDPTIFENIARIRGFYVDPGYALYKQSYIKRSGSDAFPEEISTDLRRSMEMELQELSK